MGWSAAWKAKALSPTSQPLYVLRVLSDGPQPVWSSGPYVGAEVALLPLQSQIQWGRTGPHRWPTPVSSARFALSTDASVRDLYQGSVVQLSIVLGGDEEPVWVGSLQQISREGIGAPAILACTGMEGALWSRMLQLGASGYARRFFEETDPSNTYTVALNYTAGDGTIDLAGGPTLRRRVGGSYCIRVTPNSGADFYLLGSAWSDPTMTISTAGALDTTDANANAGNAVAVVAYDAAHPLSLLSRALAGTSSWPDEWNMQLGQAVFDTDETGAQVDASTMTTAEKESFTWAAEQPTERIGDVMQPLLASTGHVVCPFQGKIAGRAIPEAISLPSGTLMDRSDIVSASWRAWGVTPQALAFRTSDRTKRDPLPLTTTEDVTTAYGALVYAHTIAGLPAPPPPKGGGASTTLDALAGDDLLRGQPVQDAIEVRVPIYSSSAVTRSNAREDVHDRLRHWSTGRPEALAVTLRGWHGYAVGDVVRVDLPDLPSRGAGPGGITTGYPALVVGGGPDFFGATTTLELLTVPTNTTT